MTPAPSSPGPSAPAGRRINSWQGPHSFQLFLQALCPQQGRPYSALCLRAQQTSRHGLHNRMHGTHFCLYSRVHSASQACGALDSPSANLMVLALSGTLPPGTAKAACKELSMPKQICTTAHMMSTLGHVLPSQRCTCCIAPCTPCSMSCCTCRTQQTSSLITHLGWHVSRHCDMVAVHTGNHCCFREAHVASCMCEKPGSSHHLAWTKFVQYSAPSCSAPHQTTAPAAAPGPL